MTGVSIVSDAAGAAKSWTPAFAGMTAFFVFVADPDLPPFP